MKRYNNPIYTDAEMWRLEQAINAPAIGDHIQDELPLVFSPDKVSVDQAQYHAHWRKELLKTERNTWKATRLALRASRDSANHGIAAHEMAHIMGVNLALVRKREANPTSGISFIEAAALAYVGKLSMQALTEILTAQRGPRL